MNKLVEEIIKPILEANSNIKKVVGIYGGRFQPFGPHHLKTYKWLAKQVDEAYISTSNIKKPPRHPMNFREKVRHMSKMGVPSNKIIEEKTPYVAKNLQKKFNKDTTAFIYVFGAKDAGRLGGSGKYYKDYKKNKNNLVGYEEHGYYLTAPHVSISVGGKEVSGTSMRELLGSDKYDDKQRAKLFKKMFGYYDKGVFQMMSNKFKKLFESDIEIIPWDNTNPKPLKKKWYDGKGKELLFDVENWLKKGSKKDREIKLKLSKLYTKAFKQMPGSANQEKIKKEIEKLRNQLSEGVDLPIEIGDTVRMGKFKNKKVVIKKIEWNEKGDLLINGRPAMKFRLEKKAEVEEGYPNEEDMKKIKKRVNKVRSQTDSNKEYQYHEIDEFLIHTDISKIIESSNTNNAGGIQGVDSGPSLMFKNSKHYEDRGQQEAEKLGWTVINYIMTRDADNLPPDEFELLDGWPIGPHNSVTYLPAGIGTGTTPNNQENLPGKKGYNKWLRNIKSVAQEVGFELMKFRKQDKDIVKQMAKDATDTIKQQEKEEVEESILTKDWWEDNLTEVSAKTKLFKQKLMRRGIKIRYDKEAAKKDLMQKYGGQGDVVGKKFGLRKAYYAVPKKGFKKDTKPVLNINKKEMEKLHKDKQLDKGNLKVVYKEASTNAGGYGADAGEPDTGFIQPGKKRMLGVDSGKPEPWLDKLGMTQLDFPVADDAYGGRTKDDRHYIVKKKVAPKEDLIEPDIIDDDIETLSKQWWLSLLTEEDVMDKTIKYKDKEGNEKEATVGGILKQGEEHPAHKKAKQMVDKGKDKKPVKKTKIDTNPFDKEEPKEKPKPKKDDSWMKGKDGWEILDDENVEVAKTKPYSEEQAREEVGEYFENKKTLKAVPNLVKDEDELTQKILDAKEEIFSSEEIQNIRNTDAGEILDASEDGGIESMKALGKQKAKEYKKGWDYITKNIESGKPQEAPIAIRDKNNELYLMAGNTRLMSNTAYGRKIPLKVIEYDGEFKSSKNESLIENLLLEGGAYGHMAHPFDDKDLTFGDLKKIIENGLGGTLSREDGVTEKLDGQNIMVSWKDGKLIAARNKGHIKNGGKTALTTSGIKSKFKGRGDIADAFNFAMKDLEKAIKSLSDKQKEKIFNNGYNFMNMEVMWPKSANVIDYDKAELVFHGALKYDDSGTVKGEVKGSGRILAGMIKQVNQHIGKKYSIGKPVFLDVPKHQDFGVKKDKFIGKLNKLKSQYALKDNDTLALYHQSYWEEYIYNAAQQFGYDIPDSILVNLTKRWAFFDKSYKIPTIRKDLKDEPKFLEWAISTDKNDHSKMVKENMKPFETLFFEVGAEILKNVKGFMAANPNKAVQGIRKRLKTSIANVKASGDKKKLNTLKLQLDKLNAIGGLSSIVPSEGIVFKYKGKTYKFTGAFAPINQITGLVNF